MVVKPPSCACRLGLRPKCHRTQKHWYHVLRPQKNVVQSDTINVKIRSRNKRQTDTHVFGTRVRLHLELVKVGRHRRHVLTLFVFLQWFQKEACNIAILVRERRTNETTITTRTCPGVTHELLLDQVTNSLRTASAHRAERPRKQPESVVPQSALCCSPRHHQRNQNPINLKNACATAENLSSVSIWR